MPPIDHDLNLTTQAILTCASWALTAVIFGLTVRLGVRERTPFYALMVVAAMVGAFAEPLYDIAMMLYFYSGPGMWTHFTAFDIPQPIWTHSGYVVLYASAAVLIARDAHRGALTRAKLFCWAAVELVMSCVFEMFGINGGAYSYWGPHVLRIVNYPLVIGVLEAAQVICFAVAAARLREHATSWWQLLGLFVVFPCTFFGANFGAGWPTIIALHAHNTSTALVAAAALLSISFAVVLVRLAASLLPTEQGARLCADAQDGARSFGQHDTQPVLGQAGVVKQR
ncbi:hypothetical protein H7I87_14820 [Mycobacterium timonense]|uniref:Uncharacterized protein n=2 Tax=Mycobacterium avium complex (MAC) TaxID=120793 RepID=A0AAW5S9B3_MYCBC|nr:MULTISPECIES: hypothetical protein [Mycobacterium avium complex (MAC)]MCV6992093.1 hypothetical protein [Mycobacterium bouchedurhonense]MCV6995967.1 hypothetical protein [Mycobacterium timonense]ORA42058.1 hypothetical protein BST19_26535 [Mycobacterium bouchedurhonense]ORB76966.1 hypothetical protein BST46_27150 [Mycobacterium timonense]